MRFPTKGRIKSIAKMALPRRLEAAGIAKMERKARKEGRELEREFVAKGRQPEEAYGNFETRMDIIRRIRASRERAESLKAQKESMLPKKKKPSK